MSDQPIEPGQLLTPKEASAYTRLSVGYLRNSACSKVVLPTGRGTKGKPIIRYRKCDLDAFVNHHRVSEPGMEKAS